MRLHSAVIAMVATTAAAKECYLVTVTGRLAQVLISNNQICSTECYVNCAAISSLIFFIFRSLSTFLRTCDPVTK